MGRTRDDGLAPAPGAAPAEPAEGAPGPAGCCRLCWYDHLVRRDGVWMLEHRGPLAECTHSCHDEDAFLPSVS